MTRLTMERAFHDEQAARRRPGLSDEALRFTDNAYLDHETWIRPAFDALFAGLGDVAGKSILDLGCGHGMASVVLARRGARVTGLDLSAGYLSEAAARARVNGVHISWVNGDAQRTPFADASFDGLWAHAIVHHLDIDTAAREMARLLKPGGRAIMCEPWGDNPALRWARRRMAYRDKNRTPDEEPLRSSCLPVLRRYFPSMRWRGDQLLGMLRRASGVAPGVTLGDPGELSKTPWWARGLTLADRMCLTLVPGLQRLCRYAIFVLDKPGEAGL